MPTPPDTTSLQDTPVPVQVTLAAAWASFMVLYVYVDVIGLYKPGVIEDLLRGVVWEFDVTQGFLVGTIVLVTIPAAMILLSTTLPARANRATNLVVATLYIPVMAFNGVGESWVWFYGLTIGLELALLGFVLRTAWTWPRTPAAAHDAAGTLAVPQPSHP